MEFFNFKTAAPEEYKLPSNVQAPTASGAMPPPAAPGSAAVARAKKQRPPPLPSLGSFGGRVPLPDTLSVPAVIEAATAGDLVAVQAALAAREEALLQVRGSSGAGRSGGGSSAAGPAPCAARPALRRLWPRTAPGPRPWPLLTSSPASPACLHRSCWRWARRMRAWTRTWR